MGSAQSAPEAHNTQGLLVTQSELTTINVHNGTLKTIIIVLITVALLAAAIWWIRRYRQRAQQAAPANALRRLCKMEAQSQIPRPNPFLFPAPPYNPSPPQPTTVATFPTPRQFISQAVPGQQATSQPSLHPQSTHPPATITTISEE